MAELKILPGKLDLWVYAGDENRADFEILADGVPVDLTGALITAQARPVAPSATIAASATIEEIDFGAGQGAMLWDGEAVRSLLAGEERWSGVWDLQVLLAGRALPTTLLAGAWTAVHDVTRTAG